MPLGIPFATAYFQQNSHHTPASHIAQPRRQGELVLQTTNIDNENIDGQLVMNKENAEYGQKGCPVAGLSAYMSRIIIGLVKGDVIIVPEEIYDPTKEVLRYMKYTGATRHYQRRFGVPAMDEGDIIPIEKADDQFLVNAYLEAYCNGTRDRAMDAIMANTRSIQPFIYSPTMSQMNNVVRNRSQLSNFEVRGNPIAAEIINHKGEALRELKKRLVRVPEGETVYTKDDLARMYRHLKELGYKKVGFKLPRSASGYGIFEIESEEDLQNALEDQRINFHLQSNHIVNYQGQDYNMLGVRVEGWMEDETNNRKVIASPGIVIKVGQTPSQDQIVSATDQLLENGIIHLGNAWPLKYWNKEMDRAVKQVANWARELGYTDVLGVDFIIVEENGELKPYIVEINGRITGQTQVAWWVKNFCGSPFRRDKAWMALNNIRIPPGMTFNEYISRLMQNGLETKRGPKREERIGKNRLAEMIIASYNPLDGKVQAGFVIDVDPRHTVDYIHAKLQEVYLAASLN